MGGEERLRMCVEGRRGFRVLPREGGCREVREKSGFENVKEGLWKRANREGRRISPGEDEWLRVGE